MTLRDNYEQRGTQKGMDLLYGYYGKEKYFSYGETIPQNVYKLMSSETLVCKNPQERLLCLNIILPT